MFEWFFGSPTKKYSIKADLFYPNESKDINYTGPNPTKILFAIGSILKQSFRIQGADTYEDVFKWDVANPTLIKFHAKWRCRKKLDDHSAFYGSISCQGEMDKKTDEGWVKIGYKGNIDTGIPYTSAFDKALKHLYFQKYHIKQLRSYTKKMMLLLYDFDKNVRDLYKLPDAPVREEAR
jgi:hypothetical protein